LRENAELACDACVVSSMESAPHGRRAYAEALLSVCESISAESQQSSPSLAMGVNTGDRRFLERRLTMILRDHRPFRLSRIGIALITLVFAGTVPAWTLRAAPEPASRTRATAVQRIPPQVQEGIRQSEIGGVKVQEKTPITIGFRGGVSGIGGSFTQVVLNPQLSLDQVELKASRLHIEATEIALNAATAEVFFMERAARNFTHDLMAYRGLVGQTIHLHLRGATGGDVWGTDIYTDDSDPNVAAVHDGILKPGEEGIAAIRLLPGIERYDGTTKNGVRTNDFGHFGGSYRFDGVQPVARPDPSEISGRFNIPFMVFLDGIGGDSASEELVKMRDQIGASVDLTVTGSSGAPIWGDGIYTDDSAVAVAAVHAGLLKVGEIGVVRATIMGPRDRYEGTSRNGIQSQSFNRFEGSYRLERVKP
jgi:LCCL domain